MATKRHSRGSKRLSEARHSAPYEKKRFSTAYLGRLTWAEREMNRRLWRPLTLGAALGLTLLGAVALLNHQATSVETAQPPIFDFDPSAVSQYMLAGLVAIGVLFVAASQQVQALTADTRRAESLGIGRTLDNATGAFSGLWLLGASVVLWRALTLGSGVAVAIVMFAASVLLVVVAVGQSRVPESVIMLVAEQQYAGRMKRLNEVRSHLRAKPLSLREWGAYIGLTIGVPSLISAALMLVFWSEHPTVLVRHLIIIGGATVTAYALSVVVGMLATYGLRWAGGFVVMVGLMAAAFVLLWASRLPDAAPADVLWGVLVVGVATVPHVLQAIWRTGKDRVLWVYPRGLDAVLKSLIDREMRTHKKTDETAGSSRRREWRMSMTGAL